MSKTAFRFDKRMEVLLGNIRVVREINNLIHSERLFSSQWELFTAYLISRLKSRIPRMKKWEMVKGLDYDFLPSPQWRKKGDAYASISIGLDDITDRSTLGDFWIGLYVDENIKTQRQVYEGFRAVVKESEIADWESNEEAFPAWCYFRLEDFVKNNGFDQARFVKQVELEFRKLVALEPSLTKAVKRFM